MAPSGMRPVSSKPATSGISMEIGWPSIAASASMPPTPQPSTPRPLTMVVWAVRADHRVRHGDPAPVLLLRPDGAGQIFEIDLVADAGAGRHDAEIAEGRLAPAQELVALAVALELAPDIGAEGIGAAVGIHHHRMVDDEVHGVYRVDFLRVAAEPGHGVAHGGEIDHRRHAG